MTVRPRRPRAGAGMVGIKAHKIGSAAKRIGSDAQPGVAKPGPVFESKASIEWGIMCLVDDVVLGV